MFYASDDDAEPAVVTALNAMRLSGGHVRGEVRDGAILRVAAQRGGVMITADWRQEEESAKPTDAAGRFAVSLGLPLLDTQAATALAEANGLCTHLTSLVLSDETHPANESFPEIRKISLMEVKCKRLLAPRASVAGDGLAHSERLATSMPRTLEHELRDQAIQQIETRALRKLKSPSRSRKLRSFLSPVDRPTANAQPGPTDYANARAIAASVNWVTAAPALQKGDVSSLPAEARLLIKTLEQDDAVLAEADRIGLPALSIAIALLASLAESDRYAQRVLRRLTNMQSIRDLRGRIWSGQVCE